MRSSRIRRRSLVFLSGFLLTGGALGDQHAAWSFPQVTTTLAPDSELGSGELVQFAVVVRDPNGERVSLRLLDPPPGLVFQPIRNALSPSTSEITWDVPQHGAARRTELLFEAQDSRGLRSRLSVPIRIRDSEARVVTGDVTGDGLVDVVAVAREADVAGFTNCGAIYVWAGSSVPSGTPTAILTATNPLNGDQIGHDGIQLGDVTGDGVLDIVADTRNANAGGVRDSGAIHVWAGGGGLSGVVHETALLFVPGANEFLQLHGSQLVDVTGDGVLDVVASSALATVGGIESAGAGYVWAGGAGLRGTLAPSATLSVPGASTGDSFSIPRIADVSGDGVSDLIGFSTADLGGIVDLGAIHVFLGGGGLSGAVSPNASLAVPALGASGRVDLADITGDGVTDIVEVVSRADVAGVVDAGAVVVWAGGSWSGTHAPRAVLVVPGAASGDELGVSGVRFADVTGDGVRDIVASSSHTDVGGVASAGAIQVWNGGAALVGVRGPLATLSVPFAGQDDQLSIADMPLVDVTGDGIADIVGLDAADSGGLPDTGAAYVWAGGAGLAGSTAPLATLIVPGAFAYDFLGSSNDAHSVRCVDVSGDGVPELIIACSPADQLNARECGAIHVFPGGAALSGTVLPQASLFPPQPCAAAQMPLGDGPGMQFADVSGDGVLDVVTGSFLWGPLHTGAVFVWFGGALAGTPAPNSLLSAPGPLQDLSLGLTGSGGGVQLADLTGDGVLDLVVGASNAQAGAFTAGVVCVWKGGATLAGLPAPLAFLEDPAATQEEYLGQDALQLADLTGDGLVDVLVGTSRADIGGVEDAGALFLWSGHSGLAGRAAPLAILAVSGAAPRDRLGD